MKQIIKSRLLIILVSLLAVANSSCSKSSDTTTTTNGGSVPATVNIANMVFGATSLTVKVGTTVTWKNKDSYAHTVTSNDGTTFDSGNLAGGASFTFTPATAGTYDYHCNLHSGMTGTLIVTQ
jgi:plastocyanin